MKSFSLLIKPASADCNLRCEYCYYLKKSELYDQTRTHRMTYPVLGKCIKSYLSTRQPVYAFAWQGGEPALMGADFFKQVTGLQKKHARSGSLISNCLQTNATLIDDALAEHLAQYRFLVGCSLDGPSEIHDRYRKSALGGSTHAAVRKGVEILRRHGVEFNILVLVSKANALRGRDVYGYLVDQGFYYHQYIPCVEFDKNGNAMPFSINGQEWGRFLCELFDCWYPKDMHRVSIRNFEAIASKRTDNSANACSLSDNCCRYFVVEYNGDIYPCDFFVDRNMLLGNVENTTWEAALSSPVYQKFGAQKSQVAAQCIDCDYFNLCMGDCLKHRKKNGFQPSGLSHLCQGWRVFFRHTEQAFGRLEKEKRADRINEQSLIQSSLSPNRSLKIGRNQPCPCGSGKKFKKCCGG